MKNMKQNLKILKYANIVYGTDWNKGVLGIAASRLVDKFYKPTIVLTLDNNIYTGSARSVANFDIYDAIDSGKQYLDQYGGHKYAAGLSIKEENLKKLQQMIILQKILEQKILKI